MSKKRKIILITIWSILCLISIGHFFTPLEIEIHWVHIFIIILCIVGIPFYKWKKATLKVERTKWMKNMVITITLCLLVAAIYRKHILNFDDWSTNQVLYTHKTYGFISIENQRRRVDNKIIYRTVKKVPVVPGLLSWNSKYDAKKLNWKNWK